MQVPARVSSVIVAALALAACGGSGSSSNPSAQSGSPVGSAAATRTGPTTTFVPALVGQGNVFFVSPSKNIGCALSETAVRCDIRERAWTPPPRPASCNLDFGQGVTLVGTSPATLSCAGDTVLFGDVVLQYGSAVTRGDFECRSETKAMRCRNLKTGHDFSLARENYTLS